MGRRTWFILTPMALVFAAAGASLGGWAIISVEEPPDYMVAGQPGTLAFTIRQHGVEPMTGLRPTIEARSGKQAVKVSASAATARGRYVATLTLPEPGDWVVTINSGFGTSKLALLPIPAIQSGAPVPAPLAEPERGRRLFVAKGCVGCHTRNEAGLAGGEEIGPALTGKRYEAAFLRRFLADPEANATRTGTFRMPDLELRTEEIAALVRFLNGERAGER
ncbi:MAG TPA: cytochrome c [Gemmatimonadales bacterium]|nr:cytochrome c [Gemmatimonadales bacterium]